MKCGLLRETLPALEVYPPKHPPLSLSSTLIRVCSQDWSLAGTAHFQPVGYLCMPQERAMAGVSHVLHPTDLQSPDRAHLE